MPDFITVCQQAARAGGAVLLDWQDRFQAREKGPRDLVTEADLASQEAIREIVLGAFPDHDFLGEEDTPEQIAQSQTADRREYRWIVDPLDGTTNYVHQLQTFAVSIALERDGKIVAGTIFDPVMDECYTAEAGKGAFLNGTRLQTSDCQSLDNALVAASFSANVSPGSEEVARFIEVLQHCQALRRLGSAALNLSYVAAGRLDAYWATSVKTWDVAAGILILCEAGGTVSGVDGSPFDLERPRFVGSANLQLHQQLLCALAQAVA